MATKYFMLAGNADGTCDGVGPADLSKTIGGAGTKATAGTQSGSFVEVGSFDVDVSGDSPVTGNHDISIDVSVAPPSDEFEYRFRAQAIDDSGCGVDNSSSYTGTLTGTGIKTLSAVNLTWAGTSDRLRISIEGRKIGGHGNLSITIRTGDVDSFINAPWSPPASQPFVQVVTGRAPILVAPPTPPRTAFFPVAPPVAAPTPANAIMPMVTGRAPIPAAPPPRPASGLFAVVPPVAAPPPTEQKYYLRHENADTTCDDTQPADMSKTQGSANTKTSAATTGSLFIKVLTFDIDVSPDGLVSGTYEVSIDAFAIGLDVLWRFRLEAVDDAGCAVDNFSAWSAEQDGTPGIRTESFALTWAGTSDRLRLRIDARDVGDPGGLNVRTGDADSWVIAPLVAAAIPFIPMIRGARPADAVPDVRRSAFFPVVAPAGGARPIIPVITSGRLLGLTVRLPRSGFVVVLRPPPAAGPPKPLILPIRGLTPWFPFVPKPVPRSEFFPFVPLAPTPPPSPSPPIPPPTVPNYVAKRTVLVGSPFRGAPIVHGTDEPVIIILELSEAGGDTEDLIWTGK